MWRGRFEGIEIGTRVTVLFFATERVGHGPRWHVHPYDEIFIMRTGRALFTIGEEKIEAETGDILLGPAEITHKYENLAQACWNRPIHVSERWTQTDLDGPELKN